jgi:hypothetical protein
MKFDSTACLTASANRHLHIGQLVDTFRRGTMTAGDKCGLFRVRPWLPNDPGMTGESIGSNSSVFKISIIRRSVEFSSPCLKGSK